MQLIINIEEETSFDNLDYYYKKNPIIREALKQETINLLPSFLQKEKFQWFELACRHFLVELDIFSLLKYTISQHMFVFSTLKNRAISYKVDLSKYYLSWLYYSIEIDCVQAYDYFSKELDNHNLTIDIGDHLLKACIYHSTKLAKKLINENPIAVDNETFIEAARVGSLEIIKMHLEIADFSRETYQDALKAAVPFYNRTLVSHSLCIDYKGDLGIIKFLRNKIEEKTYEIVPKHFNLH